MGNMVFYFSGTGNSLKVAKSLAKELDDCEIISMTKSYNLTKEYDGIGFVYPVYFWGLPKRVIEFIENVNLDNNKNTYYYSIATYGGLAGNAVYQLYELLFNRHNIKLNYGRTLRMFANYVVAYNMSEKIEKITAGSDKKLVSIIKSIKMKKSNNINKLTKMFNSINENFVEKVSNMDKNFTVDNNCINCGICEKVCPVKNIEIVDKKPQYKHHCEQCVACIQFCPQKAINYSNVTQNRRRYTNPEINYNELFEYNNK
jgi:ferredoxin